MKKMLRFETCEARGRTEAVEVPGDSPIGALYSDRGRKVGKIVPQMETSYLPELCNIAAARWEDEGGSGTRRRSPNINCSVLGVLLGRGSDHLKENNTDDGSERW